MYSIDKIHTTMKKQLVVSLLLVGMCGSSARAQLRIEDCHRKAQANYPLIKQYDLIEKTEQYSLANANKGYLPQAAFSGKATYQSEVTELPIDLSRLSITGVSIPSLSKDQYGATLDVTQTLWDGGTIKSQKDGLRAAAEVDRKNVEVGLYALNERVNQLYFGILLTDARILQNRLLQDNLAQNEDRLRSYLHNGMAGQADLDAIRVDRLKAIQQNAELVNTKKSYVAMLSLLIGEELGEDTEWVKPEAVRPLDPSVKRPELGLFDAQIGSLEAQYRQITAGLMPKVGLFATGGYGKPGLNMLDNNASAYYVGGIRLTWNIGNFYTRKNSRKIIRAKINAVEQQRETFLFNTRLDMARKNGEIDQYVEQLKYDDEIIALRGSVRRASEARMANGTISGVDLARDINAEQMAIEDKILHEMQLLLTIYNLKFATNN